MVDMFQGQWNRPTWMSHVYDYSPSVLTNTHVACDWRIPWDFVFVVLVESDTFSENNMSWYGNPMN